MMKKRFWAWFLAVIVAVSAIACSGGKAASNSSAAAGYYSTAEAAYAEDAMWDEVEAPMESEAKVATTVSGRESIQQEIGRKLIRDADLTIETKAFDTLIPSLQDQVAAFGGYLESMSESGNSYRSSSRRYAYLSARVPSDRLDEFLNVVDGLGNVVQKGMSTRDVTSSYVDIESRLAVLQTEKESLQKIMANAATTTEMLETQSRLYDVIEEIEAYEAQKRTYDSLISYSTVSINVQEVIDLTPAPEETRWEELTRRFTQSLGDLGEAIVDFCIGFIVALPWLLVIGAFLGAIFLAIFLPIRRRNKKRREKAEKEAK